MGGTDDSSNLMECTIEEHAELHLALYLSHGKYEDWVAFRGLSGQIGKEEMIRERQLMAAASRVGSKRSEETKAKMSESAKKPKSLEHAESIRQARIGTTIPSETRAKISATMTGRKRGKYNKRGIN